MTQLIATVESLDQGKKLLEAGVDILYFGQDQFGLRLPYSFSREDQATLTDMAHAAGKKVSIAVNAIFHNEGLEAVPDYLLFLKEIGVDSISVGDPGVIQIMKDPKYQLPYRYDAQVLVTSSRQINFWAERGAIEAVVAREVPRASLEKLAPKVKIPLEFLVYGATCIHQSRRPLLQNYFNYIKESQEVTKDRGLFISEPKKPDSHFSIYEDYNGTHIFANNDVLLAQHLQELKDMPIGVWKLEGLFASGDNFVAVAELFAQARDKVDAGAWTPEEGQVLENAVRALHPPQRDLDTGFYLYDPDYVK